MTRIFYRPKRQMRLLLLGVSVAAGLWVLGFGYFLGRLPEAPPAGVNADAIVVLTGGARRIETGARLLQDGTAPELFISGVNSAASVRNIPGLRALDRSITDCCVALGRSARDTWGNATEVAERYAGRHPVTLAVVTSDYHMPRAALLMRWHNPNIFIIAYRVETPLSPIYLLVEYHKFMATLIQLAFVGPVTSPQQPPSAHPEQPNTGDPQ